MRQLLLVLVYGADLGVVMVLKVKQSWWVLYGRCSLVIDERGLVSSEGFLDAREFILTLLLRRVRHSDERHFYEVHLNLR